MSLENLPPQDGSPSSGTPNPANTVTTPNLANTPNLASPAKKRKWEGDDYPVKLLPTRVAAPVRKIVAAHAGQLSKDVQDYYADPEKHSKSKVVPLVELYKSIKVVPAELPVVPTPLTGEAKVPKVATGRVLNTFTTNADVGSTGFTMKGKWTDKGYVSGRKYKAGERALQLLGDLSQVLINEVQQTQEIEAMLVNNRIMVSANEETTIAKLRAAKLAALLEKEAGHVEDVVNADFAKRRGRNVADIGAVLTSADAKGATSANVTRGAQRLARLEIDLDIYPDQTTAVAGILATLSGELTTNSTIVDGGAAAKAATLIGDAAYEGRIISVDVVMTGKKNRTTCSHAEQVLLHVLVLAGHTGPVYVAGGKRPCLSCWISFKLVQQRGYNVTFNENPGGYWSETTKGGLTDIAVALGYNEQTLDAAMEEIRKDFIGNFATDMDPAAEQRTAVDDFRRKVQNQEVHTDFSTPPHSPFDPSLYGPRTPPQTDTQ